MTDIDTLIAEDRVIRGAWTSTDDQGRQLVCLLAALSPEVAEAHDAYACPAEIMPQWLAHLTTWMDDDVSDAAWPAMIRRYAALSKRWQCLDDAAWRRAEYKSRAAIVQEAMRHTTNADALAVCGRVVALCKRVVSGDDPSQAELAAASSLAAAASWAAEAAKAAAWAAEAAEAAAARAAQAAKAAAEARLGTEEAVDRITTAILDAIEAEIVGAER